MELTLELRENAGLQWVLERLSPMSPFGKAAAREPRWYAPGQEAADLPGGQRGGLLAAQAVYLALFLQADAAVVPVVAADAELLPAVQPVQLLPEHPVLRGVEVEASDLVDAVPPVSVRPCRRPEALAEDGKVGGGDFVFPLVAEVHVVCFLSCPVGS